MSHLEPVEARQIFINDISGDTTTSDLRNLFSAAGKVINVEIDTNELNRHFAFVTFESSQGVEKAVSDLTTTTLNNTSLVCRRRTQLEQMRQKRMIEARCKLFVGNIPQQMTPNDLRRDIERLSGRNIADFRHKKGYCFVGYKTPQDAEDAKRNLKNAMCGGKSLNAEFKKEDPIRNEPGFIAVLEQAQRTLYVRDIPSNSNPESFKQIFEQYGKVRKFTLPTENRSNKLIGYAFIEYFWKEACDKALAQTESLLIDGVQIEIRISDPPKDKQSKNDHGHRRDHHMHRRDRRDDGRRSMNRDRMRGHDGGRRSRFTRNRSRSRSRSRSRDRNSRYNNHYDARNGQSARNSYPSISHRDHRHNTPHGLPYAPPNQLMYAQHGAMPPNPYTVSQNAPNRYAPVTQYNAAPPQATLYNNRAIATSYPYHAPTQAINTTAQQTAVTTATATVAATTTAAANANTNTNVNPNVNTANANGNANAHNALYAAYGGYNVNYGYQPNPYGVPQQTQPNTTATNTANTVQQTQANKTQETPQQQPAPQQQYIYQHQHPHQHQHQHQPQPQTTQKVESQQNTTPPNVQQIVPYNYYNSVQPNAYAAHAAYYQQQHPQQQQQQQAATAQQQAASSTKAAPQQPQQQQYGYPQHNYPYTTNRY